jgi:hypothetical protein
MHIKWLQSTFAGIGPAAQMNLFAMNTVPGSLNKKVGRRFHLSSIFCLIMLASSFTICPTKSALD